MTERVYKNARNKTWMRGEIGRLDQKAKQE